MYKKLYNEFIRWEVQKDKERWLKEECDIPSKFLENFQGNDI